jgi:hypothetical protein
MVLLIKKALIIVKHSLQCLRMVHQDDHSISSLFFDLELHQVDAKTTFLNRDLKDEVYMKQSKGFINNSQKACKLKNSIYGL